MPVQPVGTIGGNRSAFTPAISSASSSYAPVARSSVPVPDATETDVTRSPVSRSSTRSGRPAKAAGEPSESSHGIRRVQYSRCSQAPVRA